MVVTVNDGDIRIVFIERRDVWVEVPQVGTRRTHVGGDEFARMAAMRIAGPPRSASRCLGDWKFLRMILRTMNPQAHARAAMGLAPVDRMLAK